MRGALLVMGMALLVLGAQGTIRLMADHEDAGLLGWTPGGFAVRLGIYLVVVAVGVVLASRNSGSDTSAN